MGTARVTQGMMISRTLNDLHFQTRRLLQLQEQLATGLRVNTPSDDPLATRRAVNIRSSIAKNEQYITNISSCEPIMTETSSAMQTVVSTLQRAYELTIQGGNGTNSQNQLDLIAVEVNQLLEGMLAQANHQTQGRYIFGGTRSTSEPFNATRNAQGEITNVTYGGNDASIEVSIGETLTAGVNETGSDAFLSDVNMFRMLINIRDNLRAHDLNSLENVRITEIKTAQEQALKSLARVGATQNQLERMKSNLEDYVQQFKLTLSDNIDADYAETVINLDSAINSFTSALNAAGRILQPSLLDYIR